MPPNVLPSPHSRPQDVYTTAASVNQAAVTATQIVDHTLLASGAAAAAAAATEPSSLPNNTTTTNTTNTTTEDNLHAAVVEAAVAAVAAAESYVKQARESKGTAAEILAAAYNSVKNDDSENVNDVNVAAIVANAHAHAHAHDPPPPPPPSVVHNPIISDHHQTNDVLNEHHHAHAHTHTPNPLVSFDGDALDVAAKLAAAASVQVCKLDGDTDIKQTIDI